MKERRKFKMKQISSVIISILTAACLITPVYAEAEIFDIHSEIQEAYLADEQIDNVYEYGTGKKEYSRHEPSICDFSENTGIGESETYQIEKASEPDFSDAILIEGLEEKTYKLYNLYLG